AACVDCDSACCEEGSPEAALAARGLARLALWLRRLRLLRRRRRFAQLLLDVDGLATLGVENDVECSDSLALPGEVACGSRFPEQRRSGPGRFLARLVREFAQALDVRFGGDGQSRAIAADLFGKEHPLRTRHQAHLPSVSLGSRLGGPFLGERVDDAQAPERCSKRSREPPQTIRFHARATCLTNAALFQPRRGIPVTVSERVPSRASLAPG